MVEADGIGTSKEAKQTAQSTASYFVCPQSRSTCGNESVLQISPVQTSQESNGDEDSKQIFSWSFSDLKAEQAFCNWQV